MFRFVDSIWLPSTTKTPNGTETEWKYSEEKLFIGNAQIYAPRNRRRR